MPTLFCTPPVVSVVWLSRVLLSLMPHSCVPIQVPWFVDEFLKDGR